MKVFAWIILGWFGLSLLCGAAWAFIFWRWDRWA
jgi:hypothetical protein